MKTGISYLKVYDRYKSLQRRYDRLRKRAANLSTRLSRYEFVTVERPPTMPPLEHAEYQAIIDNYKVFVSLLSEYQPLAYSRVVEKYSEHQTKVLQLDKAQK